MNEPEKQYLNEAKELLSEGLTCLPDVKDLAFLLQDAKTKKRKLRIKLGIDPTNTELHLGHTACLHLLKRFLDHGHLPVLIIGGFTAMVGDPSGRNEARPPLTCNEVENNAKTYLKQVNKILDINKIEIVNNYDWLSKISLTELLKVAHIVTINQLIGKEAFGTRINKGQPLYLHEVLYPILQGYDSMQVKADVEIGGVDQTFNTLFGRHVQKYYGQKEQMVILVPLLIGLDGSKKMSKTFNNYIALNDSPHEVFGKTMSIPDKLIIHYFNLVTSTSAKTINSYKTELESGTNPRDIKMKLAHTLVMQLYDNEEADKAKDDFIKQFQKNEIPDQVPEFVIKESLRVIDIMYQTKLASSKAEAKRLIEGGGVKFRSATIDNPNFLITLNDKNAVLQVGKRKFVRII